MTARATTPWHSSSWFTSPWNHDPAIASQLEFPARIEIHDVTLRDGEQQAGVVFTADEKVRIAEALAEASVHRTEAGLPAVSPADFDAVKRIASMGLPSTIYAFSRCTVEDVERAIDCGVDGVVMEIPSSRHLIYRAVTGTRLFDVESGIIAGWVRNTQHGDRAEALPYLPELVGQTGAHIAMGKGSGVDNVSEWLDRASLAASDDQRLEILQQVKALSLAHKRLLTQDELDSIAASVTGAPAGQI